MKEKMPLALSVAILCLISVWVTNLAAVAPFAPTYAVFLTWASFFAAGGGKAGLKSSLINNLVGDIWGFIALALLLPALSFAGSLALPIAIFIIGGAIVLQSVVPILGFVPGCFVGCATNFAIASSALVGPKGNASVLLATAIAAVCGNLLGIASEYLAKLFVKKS